MDLREAARRHWWTAAVAILVMVMLGLVLFMLVMIGELRSQQAQQAKIISALSLNLSGAQDQLKQNGIPPKQPPPAQIIAQVGPPGVAGATGPAGPGPSDAQVAAAVTVYLSAHPIAGLPPTSDQVAAVVAVYMTQHPPAAGSPGPTGAVGATGPEPSDTQIANAVAVWEQAHPAPSGPPGPPGPSGVGATGPQGPPGPSGVGATGPQGPQGSPGPDCPSGYQPTQEMINGHQAMVCEQPPTATSPSSSASSGAAPAAKRHSVTGAAGSTSRLPPSWPVLLLSAVLVWPPEKRAAIL